MATTLSKGYKLPSTGERAFFDELEDNIELMNSHSHNGTDGELIQVKYLQKSTATILAADWTATTGQSGTYEQTVNLPSGYLMDSTEIKFMDGSGHPLFLSVEKVDSTSYKVFINDNTLTLTAVYG